MGTALTTELTTQSATFATDAAGVGGAVALFVIAGFVVYKLIGLIPKR